MSEATYRSLFGEKASQQSKVKLHTYSGEPLKVAGQRKVLVSYGDQQAELLLVMVEGTLG